MNLAESTTSAVADVPTDSVAYRPRKWPISYRSFGTLALISDATIILACGLIPSAFYNFEQLGSFDTIPQYLGTAAVVAAFFVSIMRGNNLYNPAELLDLRTQFGSVTTTWFGAFLFLAGAAFAMKIGTHFSRVAIFSFAVAGFASLVVERLIFRALLKNGLSGQKFSGRSAILITDQEGAAANALCCDLAKYGFRLSQQFALPMLVERQKEKFVSAIIAHLRGSDIEEIILGVDVTRCGDLSRLLSGLRKLPLPVMLVPVGAASDMLSRPSHAMGASICIELQRQPLDRLERATKRTVDVIASLGSLILLLPLLLITAITIKLDSPGPVLFRQKRCGFNGRPFDIFKFRTMSVLENGPTVAQAQRSDERVTRLGKWLRRSSIDELPQLLNVLNGSMSLVGPRPHALVHDSHFDKVVANYASRHHVKPGLTGWAQVHGHRGPTPTVADIQRRVDFDLWYIDNWSLRLDFFIIVRTIFEVMRGRNAY
jgi:Undecaprenyl-phosphate glucose phosphotransferase